MPARLIGDERAWLIGRRSRTVGDGNSVIVTRNVKALPVATRSRTPHGHGLRAISDKDSDNSIVYGCVEFMITRMNSADLLKQLKADGWYLVHTVGSHHQFKHPTKLGRSRCRIPRRTCRWRLSAPSSSKPACDKRAAQENLMFYPIHVHKEKVSAYGAAFPDFPGCFAAADHWQDLPRAAGSRRGALPRRGRNNSRAVRSRSMGQP